MAGGTGGHVFPALAVAEELRQRGVVVRWLGTRKGIEAELVPANNIAIDYIKVEGLRGTGIRRLLKAPFLLLLALVQSLGVISRFKPDVVLGLGGFASGPGGVAAWMVRKPLVIQEQNARAGTTNKLLAKIARRILVAFPGALPGGEHTGNPVRREIVNLPAPELRLTEERSKPRLLILGGSLGARAINDLVPRVLARFPENARPQVIHQCGARHLETTRDAYRQAGVDADVLPFIRDMARAYGWADFVVCRAGALTIAELAAAGVGSLLVPYPYAIDDHQTSNAQWLAASGAATVIQQSELTEEVLFNYLEERLFKREKLLAMANAARSMAKNDAAEVIADVCEEVCHG